MEGFEPESNDSLWPTSEGTGFLGRAILGVGVQKSLHLYPPVN